MKTRRLHLSRLSILCLWGGVILLLLLSGSAFAITLTGSNGRKVEFAGIKDATAKGITAQMAPEGPLIGVPWSKLDLAALKSENILIYAAYEMAVKGENVPLNLGTYSGEKPVPEGSAPPKRKERWPGWLDADMGGVRFMMQLPLGKPRGILLVARGDQGRAFNFLMAHQKGGGPWGQLQNKFQLALLSYEYGSEVAEFDPTKIDDFVFAEKKSGEQLIQSLKKFAQMSGNPEIENLPIAIFGSDRIGAGFAYNFVQWKPERVLAAVVAKGAFYKAPPTEASAKVPMLFIWGEYSNQAELWRSEDTAKKLFSEPSEFLLNWTNAPEYRGRGGMNGVVEYFGQKFLSELIELRLPEKVPPKPKEDPESEGKEGEKPTPDKKGADAEDKPEEPEEEETPAILEIDRSKGYVGNTKTRETSRITSADQPLEFPLTFIPTQETAAMWKNFVNDEFERPPPPPPQ